MNNIMKMSFIHLMILLCCCFCPTLQATVRIGSPLFAPPFATEVQHYALEGFDIELMKKICTELKWSCEFVPLPNIDLFPALEQHQVDFIIGGVMITPERRLLYLFSIPYLPSKAGFVTLVQSSVKLISDLKNKRIGTLQGKVYDAYLVQSFATPIKILAYAQYTDLMLALKNGDVDALFINYYSALYLEHRYPELIHVLPQPIELGEGFGIATSFNNTDKIALINQLLHKYQSDGTFVKLYNYYFQFFAN